MNVLFRVDASLQMGIGHVMRCLTLADALTASGVNCKFICRGHKGSLIDFIRDRSYVVYSLEILSAKDASAFDPAHYHWLSATQAEDAEACASILRYERPDWLIVDHYALDACWERALAPYYGKLMVIDDLADRDHMCDLLLDQTFGRETVDYSLHVPAHCQLLCGSQYALLRPEFAAKRSYSLQRRTKLSLRELLVSMGGVDKDNVTGQILQTLQKCTLPKDCRITVVMGTTAPWLSDIQDQAKKMSLATRVLVGVSDMATLMANSDLAIGAAGATSWERCCLGLPTIMIVLAENQLKVAKGLEQAGAAKCITLAEGDLKQLFARLIDEPEQLLHMSESAACIVDGLGVIAVMQALGV